MTRPRICFRLTAAEHSEFAQMIDRLVGVHCWTDLCVKGLRELAAAYQGPWSKPLEAPSHASKGKPVAKKGTAQSWKNTLSNGFEVYGAKPKGRPVRQAKKKLATGRKPK